LRPRLAALALLLLISVPAFALTDRDRALIDATARDDIEAARQLIAAGADVNAQDGACCSATAPTRISPTARA
jgi:hypothetical protein